MGNNFYYVSWHSLFVYINDYLEDVKLNKEERDENSIKCPKCGGHIMTFNSIAYDNPADAQYRPIIEATEHITFRGSCITNPLHKVELKGILIIQSARELIK